MIKIAGFDRLNQPVMPELVEGTTDKNKNLELTWIGKTRIG